MITTDEIRTLIAQYNNQPLAVGKEFRELIRLVPHDLANALAPLLPDAADTPGGTQLVKLLLAEPAMFEMLTDPAALSAENATRIAVKLQEQEPLFDARLTRWLFEKNRVENQILDHRATERCLTLLSAISDGSRILPQVMQLMRENDPRVRSKAASLTGKANRNLNWFLTLVTQADPRVLANAIEPLWHTDWRHAREVFMEALNSSSNRVVGNAVVGLYRHGEIDRAQLEIRRLTVDPDPAFRATAAWAIGELLDRGLLDVLSRLASDQDGRVRRNAVRAMARIRRGGKEDSSTPPSHSG